MPEPPAKVARIMPEVAVNGVEGAVKLKDASTLKYHNGEADGNNNGVCNGVSSAVNAKSSNGEANGDIRHVSNGGHVVELPGTESMVENEEVGDGSELLVKRLSEDAKLPQRGSLHAAGLDLYSAEEKTIPAKGKELVPTKLAITVPVGSYGRIAPRSGLAWKHFIDVGAGVIDHDYTGEVGVLLFNFSDMPYHVKKHERVAQLVIERIFVPKIKEVEELPKTKRGATGYGASGKH